MMNKPESKSIDLDLSRILSAAKNFRQIDSTSTGMVFTDNWYDSHPRLLIFDPVLNPYDKLVWLAIRSRCTPDMSMASFPSYSEIQSLLSISRGTVSSSIAKLRMTRWITLLSRERERDESGQFVRDGNIYMVHGEPLNLTDTFALDTNYMGYVNDCRKHRNSDVRKIAELILSSLRHEIELGQNVMEHKHPFERRAEAWMAVSGDTENSFFGSYPNLADAESQYGNADGLCHGSSLKNTVVHEMNYGNINNLDEDQTASPVRTDHLSSNTSSSKEVVKNNHYHKMNGQENSKPDVHLVFPDSVTENQKQLIELNLKRLPDHLPEVPKPWQSWHQLLLDELDGRIKAGLAKKCTPVWNPVSLMSTYCKRLIENGIGLKENGQFQIENAELVYEQRTEGETNRELLDEVRRRYEQRTLERAMKNSS